MKHQRNVDGLRQNAQKKRQESFKKVDRGIEQLIKDGKPISFTTVEEASGVSKAWLYKEAEVKARIEHLRSQTNSKKQAPSPKHRLSDASKDAIITTLKERAKKVEHRNRELSRQNEVFGGQVLRVRELEQQIKRLQAENEELRCRLSPLPDPTSQPPSIAIDQLSVYAELIKLGVDLNSTIKRRLKEAPHEVIIKAIDSLREARAEGRVDNPSGFFNCALTDEWKANASNKQMTEQDVFSVWWDLAHSAGLVLASMQQQGSQYILTNKQEWICFDEMLETYPLERLRTLSNADSEDVC